MDPKACYQRFLDHTSDNEIVEALHAIDDLMNWYRKSDCVKWDDCPSAMEVEGLRKVYATACEYTRWITIAPATLDD